MLTREQRRSIRRHRVVYGHEPFYQRSDINVYVRDSVVSGWVIFLHHTGTWDRAAHRREAMIDLDRPK